MAGFLTADKHNHKAFYKRLPASSPKFLQGGQDNPGFQKSEN